MTENDTTNVDTIQRSLHSVATEGPMTSRRNVRRLPNIPMPAGFVFFSEELRYMHRMMCIGIRHSTEPEYGEFDERERGFVARQVWRMLRAVKSRRPSGVVPPSVLEQVFCSALIAYRTARMCGKSPGEARHSAVTFAIIPLWRHIDGLPPL